MTFQLPMADEKIKPHQVTALHLLVALAFVGAGAIFEWLYLPARVWGICLLISGIILLLLAIFKNKWLTGSANKIVRIIELIILLCLAAFTAIKQWHVPEVMFGILSLAIIFALYWEGSADKAQYIIVDNDGIKLPLTSRKRFVGWVEIEKVILRFGTLTVDCHNQRFFQWNVQPNDVDEEIFEGFCENQVEVNRSKRRNDDW
jgi:hypothetical protein